MPRKKQPRTTRFPSRGDDSWLRPIAGEHNPELMGAPERFTGGDEDGDRISDRVGVARVFEAVNQTNMIKILEKISNACGTIALMSVVFTIAYVVRGCQ